MDIPEEALYKDLKKNEVKDKQLEILTQDISPIIYTR